MQIWATSLTRFNDILAARKRKSSPFSKHTTFGEERGPLKRWRTFTVNIQDYLKSWCIYAEGNLLYTKKHIDVDGQIAAEMRVRSLRSAAIANLSAALFSVLQGGGDDADRKIDSIRSGQRSLREDFEFGQITAGLIYRNEI